MRFGRICLLAAMSISAMAFGSIIGGIVGAAVNTQDGSGVPVGIATGLFLGHLAAVSAFLCCECLYKRCWLCRQNISVDGTLKSGACCGDSEDEAEYLAVQKQQMLQQQNASPPPPPAASAPPLPTKA